MSNLDVKTKYHYLLYSNSMYIDVSFEANHSKIPFEGKRNACELLELLSVMDFSNTFLINRKNIIYQ